MKVSATENAVLLRNQIAKYTVWGKALLKATINNDPFEAEK